MFSPRSCMVSCLMFIKQFWIYFCAWCENVFWFHWFTCSCPVSPTLLAEETLFPILYSCLLCRRLIDHRCLGSLLSSLVSSTDLYVCFLYKYHTALITVALQYCLKSWRVMPPACFFSLRLALEILSFFMVPYKLLDYLL